MNAKQNSKEVREVLKRAIEAIELAMKVLQAKEFNNSESSLINPYQGIPMVDRIRLVLKSSPSQGLTPNEIASFVNGSPGAVRMILYENQGKLFHAHRISPRHIRWTNMQNSTDVTKERDELNLLQHSC